MDWNEGLTRDDFIRIVTEGPNNLREALWLYLYKQGFITIPLSWSFHHIRHDVGLLVLALVKPVVDAVARRLIK